MIKNPILPGFNPDPCRIPQYKNSGRRSADLSETVYLRKKILV